MSKKPGNMANDIVDAIEKATSKWAKTKKSEERSPGRVSFRRVRMTKTRRGMTAKAAAEQVMEEAYMLASAGNTLPAAARQIMYAARPKIQELTGEPLSDKYFTQYLLPDYINEHEPDWDVTFDARGHFTEPHTEYEIAMGTLEVRAYLNEVGDPEFRCGEFKTGKIETVGPEANFGALMYVEKEGFAPLWQRSKIAERHDIAIMSNKGNSVTAGRRLADEICHHYGIPLVVLRDFDVAGFTIVDLFRRSTRRYQFENDITVIDLGLRLADVQEMNLESEDAAGSKSDKSTIRERLLREGATDEEAEFLLHKRVEINALHSDQLVDFVERKLREHGIEKVIPDRESLDKTYRLFELDARLKGEFERVAKAISTADVPVPPDLDERVAAILEDEPELRWDAAVRKILGGPESPAEKDEQ